MIGFHCSSQQALLLKTFHHKDGRQALQKDGGQARQKYGG